MSGLKVKDKDIVVPGEVLATGMDFLPGMGTYRQGDNILAAKVGLTNIDGRAIKLITLSGRYLPKRGDNIIGKIQDIMMSGWRIDINSAYTAVLPLKDATSQYIQKGADLSRFFNFGDYIMTKIVNVTTQKLVDVSMKGPGLRKLHPGRIIHVTPCKVPRIIGKNGSMVSMIKQATDCRILVGQNGIVWVSGPDGKNELIAVETIHMIEQKSHVSGLTDLVKAHLEKVTGKKITLATTKR